MHSYLEGYIERHCNHFAKYLPENISWEKFDDIVYRVVFEKTVFKKLSNEADISINRYETTQEICKYYKSDNISICVMMSFQRLKADKKIKMFSSGIGMGPVMTMNHYEIFQKRIR